MQSVPPIRRKQEAAATGAPRPFVIPPHSLDLVSIKWYIRSMTGTAKVFQNGRSQAIRLPKEFRVAGAEVRLTRVPGGILISEADPWDRFVEGCRDLPEEMFEALANRRKVEHQKRDFTAGLP